MFKNLIIHRKLSYFFLYILAFYPVLKYNISSIALIGLLLALVSESVYTKSYSVSKKSILQLLKYTGFFLLLVLSYTFSENKNEALSRIVQLAPLFIVPAIIILCNIKLSKTKRELILNLFICSNILHLLILVFVYFLYIKDVGSMNLDFSTLMSNHNIFQDHLNDILGYDIITVHKAYFSMGYVLLAVYSLYKILISSSLLRLRSIFYIISFYIFTFFTLSNFSFPNVLALIFSISILFFLKRTDFRLPSKTAYVFVSVLILLFTAGIIIKSKNIDVKRGTNFLQSIIIDSEVEQDDPRKEIYKSIASIYNKASFFEIVCGYGIGDLQSVLNNDYKNRLTNQQGLKNLLFFNEEFNSDYWHKNNITVKPNIEYSPNGNLSVDKIIENSSSIKSSFNLSRIIKTNPGEMMTLSIFAKGNKASNLILRLGDINHRVSYDLIKKTTTNFNPSSVKASIEKKNDWYRCSITTKVQDSTSVVIGISDENNNYKYIGKEKSLLLWGAQLEYNNHPTTYVKNNSELLNYVTERELNTHNNYLYFFMAAGIIGLLSFLFAIGLLTKRSLSRKDILQITFCIILLLNLITENIFSRHFGLMFTSLFLLLLYTKSDIEIE